jgi:membrane protease subunit HflK
MPFDGPRDGGPGGTRLEFPDFGSLRKHVGTLRWLAIAVVAIVFLVTSVYTVQPEEVGVVLRLGVYNRAAQPGLRFKIPFGIEKLFKLPVQRQLKAEFGFATPSAGVRRQTGSRGHKTESAMLTGDLNAAVVEWVVQYRIADAENYLFRVRNVEQTFRDMTEAAMRRVVGDRTVNEVITIGRQAIEDQVKQDLQALCDTYQTGIRVDQVVLQDVNPPDPVRPSFNEVNQAEQERERLINEAQSQYNQVIPRAEGEAKRTIQEAEGYALDRVNRAEGDAARFRALYAEYRKAPEVTRQRIYLETMNEILPKAGSKFVIDDDLQGVLPLLNLGGPSLLPSQQGGQP